MKFEQVAVKAGVKNNVAVEPFDFEQFKQSEQGKQAVQKNELENFQDEIDFYLKRIDKKKKDIERLERRLARAERKLKEAQEAERANKIKDLLEANKGKRVIIEDGLPFGESQMSALAEEIEVLYSNGSWVIGSPNNQWGVVLEYVGRIFIEAEI